MADQQLQQQPFLGQSGHQAAANNQLQNSWDAQQRQFLEDQFNSRLSVSMDRLDLEMNPPVDRYDVFL